MPLLMVLGAPDSTQRRPPPEEGDWRSELRAGYRA
jgi:hypothetical protein